MKRILIKNYNYTPLDALKKVQSTLSDVRGIIPELIAQQYKIKIEDAVRKKEKLGSRGKKTDILDLLQLLQAGIEESI